MVGDTLKGCFPNLISGYNTLYSTGDPAILYFEYDPNLKTLKKVDLDSRFWTLTSFLDKVQTSRGRCQSICNAPLALKTYESY